MVKGLAEYLINHPNFYIFGLLFLSTVVLYFIIGKAIKNSRMHFDQKRRFMANTRAIFFLILTAAVFILWANELYQFVISLAAILAAFAIAGKELFLCYAGSFYKTFARPFSVGDRIQVGDIRGDVVDIGLLSTQLLEVGPKDYTQQLTGRTITIPNAVFLDTNVFNETDNISEGRDFVLHVFKIPIKNDDNWKKHKDVLIKCAHESCSKYFAQAEQFFTKLANKRHVGIPFIEPRVNVKFETADSLMLMVRVTVPVERKGTIEQEIINSYLEKTHT